MRNNLFIRIPRTGSTSICDALYGDIIKHRTALVWRDILGEETFYKKFKFTVVRDPYDRFISAFYYFKELHGLGYEINEFLNKFDLDEFRKINSRNNFVVRPQTDFILDDNGVKMVNLIINFENLENGWKEVCGCINFPYRNLKRLRKSNKGNVDLSEKSKEKIREFYKLDFEFLGYEQ